MAMRRTSLKGKGVDMFVLPDQISEPANNHNRMTAYQHTSIHPKATYYLPEDLQHRLDDLWMARRKSNRKLTKSEIVRQALESYLYPTIQERP
jgi:hypothetical protein